MAISARAAGTWAEMVADGTVAIPAAQVTGDLMLLLAFCKPYTVTTTVSGWESIGEFADGTVGNGNGVGSVKVAAWYKVATTDTETDPTLDWSADPNTGAAVIVVFSKAASEGWVAPAYVTAAMTNWTTTSQTVSASSTIDTSNGDAIVGLIGIRDDSSTMTRPTTGIAGTGPTWNGDYVEYPATHFSTTTGFDCSGDAGYRLITTGSAGVTLTQTGTISAAETGAAMWVRLRVQTATSATATVATATGDGQNTGGTVKTGELVLATGTGAAQGAAPTVAPTSIVTNATGAGQNATVQTTTGEITFTATVAAATADGQNGHGSIAASLGFATGRSA